MFAELDKSLLKLVSVDVDVLCSTHRPRVVVRRHSMVTHSALVAAKGSLFCASRPLQARCVAREARVGAVEVLAVPESRVSLTCWRVSVE